MAESNVNHRNVLVGYGDLYWAPYGTALPDFTTPTVDLGDGEVPVVTLQDYFDDAASDWGYLGATQDGVELNYTPDYGEVEVDQVKDAIILFNQSINATLSTNLAEATLENLLFAWGVADEYLKQTATTKSFSIGVPGEDPIERALVVISKGAPFEVTQEQSDAVDGPYTGVEPGTYVPRQRLYHARRVISFEGSSLALRRTENTAFPVQFRLLPDAAFRDAEYGLIIDRVPGDETAPPNPEDVFRTNADGTTPA